MRIVSGKYGGRNLVPFSGEKIRPTPDMVRESLFNILRDKIYGASFLDLFCGTGAVGIEALSRGAEKVCFNDIDRDSIAVLKKNLEKLKVSESVKIFNKDAITLLESAKEEFDFIYADPPYKSGLGIKALPYAAHALKKGGTLIYENETPFSDEVPKNLKIKDERKYGRVYITFFIREEE